MKLFKTLLLTLLLLTFKVSAVQGHYEVKAVSPDGAYAFAYYADPAQEDSAKETAIKLCEQHTEESCAVVYTRWTLEELE